VEKEGEEKEEKKKKEENEKVEKKEKEEEGGICACLPATGRRGNSCLLG